MLTLQCMQVLALSCLAAMVNSVDLPKSGLFTLLACVEGTDGDAAFKGIHGLCEAFPFYSQGLFVFFKVAVYGRGAYLFEHFRYFTCDAESRPLGDVLHLLPHKRGKDLPTLEPEKGPDMALMTSSV